MSTPDGLSYEQAREQLADIVRQLEQGGGGLEESLTLWERGEQLAATCQAFLDGAQQRLDTVLSGESGQPSKDQPGQT